ncbi:zinc finger protein 821 isoform X1 [Boleophthalmus pectinirostris]|uniref:zinc finger protein 821 isoform X1 n=1 Tax=Boleophthalmus pectinirostris TaxID=150288 RepID=UPI000A1C26AC|nr:zinc finger protein 821 isoform X1 [Boleophthalmus pectinirostris]
MGPFHPTGMAGLQHTISMDSREDFPEESECSQELQGQDSLSEDSDSDPDNHEEDLLYNTSADDPMSTQRAQCRLLRAGVKEESLDTGDHSTFACPLCSLDFGSPEKLISHVYQHTTMMSNNKSYVCPVCGRALSSPGSLGRHLLIHSEDRLSNCAVCGARFTDTNNFNREKLKEVLDTSRLEVSGGRDVCSLSLSSSPMVSPSPVERSCHAPGSAPCHLPPPDQDPNLCQGSDHISSQCQGPRPCAGSDQPFPSLPDSLLSEGPSLASIPEALNSSSSSLPPIPDILSPMPVYPAGVLLVCNSCVAYQQLVDAQSPMRKWALRRKNEPLEARLQRLERERTAKKNKRACETEEERELRRLRDREAKRIQRMQETEEQRARRLQRDREAMRAKRANETPEKRQARLIREREAKRIKRRLEKIDPALRTQIEHDPAAMAALTADMSLFQFPCPMPVSSIDNGLFMKLP